MVVKPYTDETIDGRRVRTFDSANTSAEDYVWHRDLKDRQIEVLEGTDWQLQFDNELPQFINIADKIFIPAMVYHRIIPGKTKLRIEINEEL